jgi:hypothetical protein
MMQLNHYPSAIAQAAQRLNEIDSQLLAVQQVIHRMEGHAERVAAFEPELKNDNQRKARRNESTVDQSRVSKSGRYGNAINYRKS